MALKRLFVAIELPDASRAELSALDPGITGLRWVEREKMHLTVSFFGNTTADAEEKLRERLALIEFKPFFLPLIGFRAFPAKGRPNVIWIGVGAGHPHLFQMYKRVQEAALGAGIEPDLRSFHPHVTVARCRDLSREAITPFLKAQAAFDAGMIHVEEFHLISSNLRPPAPFIPAS